jgi:hypothetical protein
MKRLSTTAITTGVAMPLKSGLLDFLQDAHKETTADLVANLLGFTPDADTVYILLGCVNSNTAPTYNVSAGVVFYNGEIYDVPAFSFTTTGSNLPYPNLVITQYTTNADPVEFTDGTPRNVCDIRKLVVTSTATSTGFPIYDNWFRGGAWIYGDTKEIVCNSSYVSTHFDSTGLGRKERKGWAIMNGNNGTPNDNGLVVVAYGTDYTTLGATGGSKDAVLVQHTHTYASGTHYGLKPGGEVSGSGSFSVEALPAISTEGVSGTNKNMQPYVVRLRIMKING